MNSNRTKSRKLWPLGTALLIACGLMAQTSAPRSASNPEVPIAQHFREVITSDGPAASDTSNIWTAGQPILPETSFRIDSSDDFEVWSVSDSTAVQYDIRHNRYRVLFRDGLDVLAPAEPLDPIDRPGGYRPKRR